MADDDATRIDGIRPEEASALAAIGSGAHGQISTENFPVALRLLPRRPRAHLARLYGYARFVDDVGDEALGDRGRMLDLIEADVRALWVGAPVLAPVAALGPLIEDCAIPIAPLLDLIEANRIDQITSRYETFEDLLAYCRLSAAPVGRLVLYVAGAVSDRNVADSDAVCVALQVLEHCQDVGEDARAGRVYLPGCDLRAAGVRTADLLANSTSPSVRGVIGLQVERSRQSLVLGNSLGHRLSGWARLAVAGYVAGGMATATALQKSDYDVLARRVRPSRARTVTDVIRLLTRW